MDIRKQALLRRLAGGLVSAMVGFGAGGAADEAGAVPITFTHEGTAANGGTLDGGAFGAVDFVVTATADTDDREELYALLPSGPVFAGYRIPHLAATIELVGIGTYDLLEATRTFLHQNSGEVGFDSAADGRTLFEGPADAALGTYDLASAIGPVSGTGTLANWALSAFDTSGGVLDLADATAGARFTATLDAAVPLPPTIVLLVGAFGGLAAFARRGARPA